MLSHLRCNQIPLLNVLQKTCPRLEIVFGKEKQVLLRFAHCYSFSLSRLVVLMWAVRQTVPSQVTVAPKHLSAAATAVGLDVCMGEKVSFQVTSLIKGSSACGAFVGRLLFRFKQRIIPFNCAECLSVIYFTHLNISTQYSNTTHHFCFHLVIAHFLLRLIHIPMHAFIIILILDRV